MDDILRASVKLSGIGLITPALRQVSKLAQVCTRAPLSPGTRVEQVPPPAEITARKLRREAHLSRLALYAAHQALAAAGEELNLSIVMGLTHGSTSCFTEFHDLLLDYGPEMASPNAFSGGVTTAPLGAVSQHLGVRGGGVTVVGYENCGLDALIQAAHAILDRRVPACLVGAAEEYSPLVQQVYARQGWFSGEPPEALPAVLDAGASPPTGFGASEGSVFFVAAQQDLSERAPGCLFYPVEEPERFDGQADLIISGAGGGPQDAAELRALEHVLHHQRRPPPVLFSKCFFGETFAVGPLLSAALAWDILQNGSAYPLYPLHPNLLQHRSEQSWPTEVRRVLVLAGSRSGEVSASLFGVR